MVQAADKPTAVSRWNNLSVAHQQKNSAPLLVLEGLATVKGQGREELAVVGTPQQWVASNYDGNGRCCALRMQQGAAYRCEVFEVPALQGTPRAHLPSDQLNDGVSAEFYAQARTTSRIRWDGDRRIRIRNEVAAWTDGLGVSSTDGMLQVGHVYRVVVTKLP